jgi:hypothetical protein
MSSLARLYAAFTLITDVVAEIVDTFVEDIA